MLTSDSKAMQNTGEMASSPAKSIFFLRAHVYTTHWQPSNFGGLLGHNLGRIALIQPRFWIAPGTLWLLGWGSSVNSPLPQAFPSHGWTFTAYNNKHSYHSCMPCMLDYHFFFQRWGWAKRGFSFCGSVLWLYWHEQHKNDLSTLGFYPVLRHGFGPIMPHQTTCLLSPLGNGFRSGSCYPLVDVYSLRTWKWPIEIVDLPMKNGDFPVRKLLVYQQFQRRKGQRWAAHGALPGLGGAKSYGYEELWLSLIDVSIIVIYLSNLI